MRVASLFSGIGAFEFALKRLDINHEIVFACDNGDIDIDIDIEHHRNIIKKMSSPLEQKKYVDDIYTTNTNRTNFVKISYLENYPLLEDKFYQDVRLFDGTKFKDIDILVGGSPCQSFSSVGSQFGLEDARGTLFYEFARVVDEIRPRVFIYENVRGLYTHDKGNTWKGMKRVFDELGYTYFDKIIDAKDFGVPQTRRRLFVVGFKEKHINFSFPEKIDLTLTAQDLLIDHTKTGAFKSVNSTLLAPHIKGEYDKKYFLSPKLKDYVMKSGTKSFYQKPEIDLKIARTVLSSMGNRHRAGVDNYYTVDGEIRMLTEREAHRLMGFTDDYKIVVSRAQAYKQAGNSIVVDVLIHIIKKIIAHL